MIRQKNPFRLLKACLVFIQEIRMRQQLDKLSSLSVPTYHAGIKMQIALEVYDYYAQMASLPNPSWQDCDVLMRNAMCHKDVFTTHFCTKGVCRTVIVKLDVYGTSDTTTINHVHCHLDKFPCCEYNDPDVHHHTKLIDCINECYMCIGNDEVRIHVCEIGMCPTIQTRDGMVCRISNKCVGQDFGLDFDNFSHIDNVDKPSEHDTSMTVDEAKASMITALVDDKPSIDQFNIQHNIPMNFDSIAPISKHSQHGILSDIVGQSDPNRDKTTEESDPMNEIMADTYKLLEIMRTFRNGYSLVLNSVCQLVHSLLFSDTRLLYEQETNQSIKVQMADVLYKYFDSHIKENHDVYVENVNSIIGTYQKSIYPYVAIMKKMYHVIPQLTVYYASIILQVYINLKTRTPYGSINSSSFQPEDTFVGILTLMAKHGFAFDVTSHTDGNKDAPFMPELGDWIETHIEKNIQIIPHDPVLRTILPDMVYISKVLPNIGNITDVCKRIMFAFSSAFSNKSVNPFITSVPSLDTKKMVYMTDSHMSCGDVLNQLITNHKIMILAQAYDTSFKEMQDAWDSETNTIDNQFISRRFASTDHRTKEMSMLRKQVSAFGPVNLYIAMSSMNNVEFVETPLINSNNKPTKIMEKVIRQFIKDKRNQPKPRKKKQDTPYRQHKKISQCDTRRVKFIIKTNKTN